MSGNSKSGTTRREVFKTGLIAAAGTLAATTLLVQPAQAKMAQKAVMYQGKPQGAQSCANCARFVPNKAPGADGTCTIVDGNISPQGWCAMYVPKH